MTKFCIYTPRHLYPQSQYSNTWDSKCLALIAQVVRAFGMNPKVGSLTPPQVETFSVSKSSTLSQEHPFVSQKMNAVVGAQLTFLMLTSLQKHDMSFKNINSWSDLHLPGANELMGPVT